MTKRPRQPRTAGQLAAAKRRPLDLDPETPIFTATAKAVGGPKVPTFQRWETHTEFLIRHQYSQWLYANTYGMSDS